MFGRERLSYAISEFWVERNDVEMEILVKDVYDLYPWWAGG